MRVEIDPRLVPLLQRSAVTGDNMAAIALAIFKLADALEATAHHLGEICETLDRRLP